nr:hypothetical protein [Tanacetum cinerariifolium]
MLYHYKLGLSQVEARLVEFKNQEIKFCEKIRGLEFNVEAKANKIKNLTNELETLKKEKEGLDSKLTGFKSASKDLDNLLESQSKWVDQGRLWAKNNNTHKSRTPRTVFHKTGRPQMRTNRPNMNVAQPKRTYFYKPTHSYVNRPFQRKSAVRTQVRVPTVNRKFPTVNRKFPTGNSKFSTADMGNKGTAVKVSACWIWKPTQNLSNKGPNSNCVSVMFKKYTYIDTQGRLKSIMSLLIEDMCHLVKEDARLLAKEQSKPDERGIVIRNKARLVAQGHIQEEGINYDEDPEFPARVYKVEKAMYGLHQAPRAWYGTLSKYLLTNGFQRGKLNFFLGLQVLQKKDGIFLSQDKYVGDILKKLGYSNVRSSNTLMDKENPWVKEGTRKYVDLYLYRSMIGSLMYLTASRPDIMFAVYACVRHQVTPKECHLHTVKRIFRYLKGHPNC